MSHELQDANLTSLSQTVEKFHTADIFVVVYSVEEGGGGATLHCTQSLKGPEAAKHEPVGFCDR